MCWFIAPQDKHGVVDLAAPFLFILCVAVSMVFHLFREPGSVKGKSTIEIGVPVKGTVESSDRHCYVIGPPTVSGYEDVYQMEVTADTTYTVNCTSDYVTIQDADSGGEFTAQGGTQSADMNCFDSPATWLPRRTGVVTINVLAAADEVPQSYTMTFSK
jgi:hypothetical protein